MDVAPARAEHLLKKIDVRKVEAAIKYRFREGSFLLQALTHCSYSQNKVGW